MSTEAKLHHYVPVLLLKHFAFGRQKKVRQRKIWVFDKQQRQSWVRPIGKVAAENGFYDLESGSSVENWFHQFETPLAAVIGEIVAQGDLQKVSHQQRSELIGVLLDSIPSNARGKAKMGRYRRGAS